MNRRSDIGWFELIVGIILIIFGVVIMRQPVGVLTWIVILCGVLAILSGIGILFCMSNGTLYRVWTDSFTCHRNPECDGRIYARGTSGSRNWAIAMILPIWILRIVFPDFLICSI